MSNDNVHRVSPHQMQPLCVAGLQILWSFNVATRQMCFSCSCWNIYIPKFVESMIYASDSSRKMELLIIYFSIFYRFLFHPGVYCCKTALFLYERIENRGHTPTSSNINSNFSSRLRLPPFLCSAYNNYIVRETLLNGKRSRCDTSKEQFYLLIIIFRN